VLHLSDSADTGWTVLARTADIVGLIAFAVVIVGVISALITRPRLRIQRIVAGDILTVRIDYRTGSRPARNVNVMFRGIDNAGHSVTGADSIWRRHDLLPGDGQWIVVYNAMPTSPPLQPDSNAVRVEVPMPSGVLLSVTWDHASLPGLKSRWVVVWTEDARGKGGAPTILKGHSALDAIQVAMRRSDRSKA
jgi:hypothetical protein